MTVKRKVKRVFFIVTVVALLYCAFFLKFGSMGSYFSQSSENIWKAELSKNGPKSKNSVLENSIPGLAQSLSKLAFFQSRSENHSVEQEQRQLQKQQTQLQQQIILENQHNNQDEKPEKQQQPQLTLKQPIPLSGRTVWSNNIQIANTSPKYNLTFNQDTTNKSTVLLNSKSLLTNPVQSNGSQANSSFESPGLTQNIVIEKGTLLSSLHSDIVIVPSHPAVGFLLSHKDCVPLPKSPRKGVVICIHPVTEDIWVSGELKKNKLWEENLILHMQKVLETDTRLMLLDLGSNIGEYTLWASALGREVIAVEMLMSNVQLLQTSLHNSGLSHRVTIINNALFSDHRILEAQFMTKNIGGSRLNTSNVYEVVDSSKLKVKVRTICMDDLIPLLKGKSVYVKMDIENSEHHALACAHNLFKEVDVKIVQIEWINRTPTEADQILHFMNLYGYVSSKSALNYEGMDVMLGDIYFLKKSAFLIP